ncbi:MAG: hypothetical protein J7J29_04620 [Psychrobacter sp.]|jgi:hypothetical protein|uniref:hypothetical protein n=1 Tax=Psychrobacter sp. UBA3068 TaxID=1947349 RepID=UPI00257EA210|nr:hypothetical protein [Psychrobacter sp. UBA3068]MCD6251587.1 hypothetical protein [Psychrobacter sp.]
MNIYDLSDYQLYKLKSLDPNLSSDWPEVLQSMLPELDRESVASIYNHLLVPRGIYLDADRNLAHRRPITLREVMASTHVQEPDLLALVTNMSNIIASRSTCYDASKLADEIEAIFRCLDHLNLQNEHENIKNIRVAFLYDLAQWLDTVELKVSPGLRKLDSSIVKSYLKEVFIKQKIQGQDFRRWDSTDLDFQDLTDVPTFIRNEGKSRKFFVVEGQDYWFLVGNSDVSGKNPYSFRRFLHEETSGSEKYTYLTHVVIKKNEMQNSEYLSSVAYAMSRFYTLDLGTPDTLLSFIKEIKFLKSKYLKPLLKERLEQTGASTDAVVNERMLNYEKQVSILILQKLPRIQATLHNKVDQGYLFYHLDKLIKQMIESVHDFRLQPLVSNINSSGILLIKLMALRKLLTKSYGFILSQDLSIEERTDAMTTPLLKVQEKINATKVSMKELRDLKENLDNYSQVKNNGSFWEKIALGRKPNYTLKDINKEKLLLKKDVFTSIVRMAKIQEQGMVYVELECDEIIDRNYRHYALADGKLGITRLPRILQLPEDPRKLKIESISQIVNYNVFEANPLWDPLSNRYITHKELATT